MEVPKDIFKKPKRKRIEIPNRLFAQNNSDIPDKVIIKYKGSVDVDKLHQVIEHKYDVLKRNGEDVSCFNYYLENYKDIITEYKETRSEVRLQEYLNIFQLHMKLEFIKHIDYTIRCKGCNKEMTSDEETEENIYVCEDCDCINTFLRPNSYSRTSERYSSTEDDTNNFMKVLDKFEGKFEPHPDEELYEELDMYFESMGMETGEYYRELECNDKGKKDGTNKKKLWDALENTGNNKYYDESNFIAHKYWGWKLPDLSLYREQLISDYQETQNVWNKIKYRYNRSASLGTQFRLYVHLQAIGYDCEREDFKIQDMVESLRMHNDAWKEMCDQTGLKYVFVS